MDDLEAIRQRRLKELQERQSAAAQNPGAEEQAAAQQAAAEEAAIERLLQQILEPEARERLTRIRMSRPDLADGVSRYLVSAVQQGKFSGRIRDEDLKVLLARLTPKDRDISITRR